MASAASTRALEISAQKDAALSKNQKEFNRLTARIEKLRKEILLEEDKFESLLKTALEHLIPAKEEFAKAKIQLAMTLDQAAMVTKFGKNQLRDIGECIRDLYNEAFVDVIATEEDKAVYNRWSESSYDEELEAQKADERDFLQDMLRNMFDMEVDLDQVKDNPEEFQRLQEEMEQKMPDNQHQGRTSKKKPKTKAQQRAEDLKEAKLKAVEDLKSKSVRSIYISLAKLVHPDTETDDLQRAVKEEEMKKLSAAYERNDLATLLVMEMDWIHKQNDHLSSISDDRLTLYIQVLKDQVKELENEKFRFGMDPRYGIVAEYAFGQTEAGIRKIKADARRNQQHVLEIKREVRDIQGPDGKRHLLSLLKVYMQKLQFKMRFDFF